MAWTAFCLAEPLLLTSLLECNTACLPFLASAITRHLE